MGVQILHVLEDAAAVLAHRHNVADELLRGNDRRLDKRLTRLGDDSRVGIIVRIVDIDGRAVGLDDLVDDRGQRRDQIQVKLALQAFLDDLHVQHAQKAAAKAKAQKQHGGGPALHRASGQIDHHGVPRDDEGQRHHHHRQPQRQTVGHIGEEHQRVGGQAGAPPLRPGAAAAPDGVIAQPFHLQPAVGVQRLAVGDGAAHGVDPVDGPAGEDAEALGLQLVLDVGIAVEHPVEQPGGEPGAAVGGGADDVEAGEGGTVHLHHQPGLIVHLGAVELKDEVPDGQVHSSIHGGLQPLGVAHVQDGHHGSLAVLGELPHRLDAAVGAGVIDADELEFLEILRQGGVQPGEKGPHRVLTLADIDHGGDEIALFHVKTLLSAPRPGRTPC